MVRESIFNILNHSSRVSKNINNSKILDLFSGTGSFGIKFYTPTTNPFSVGITKHNTGFKCNIPDGAFYVFPNISHYFGKTIDGFEINNASDMSMFLLEKALVATVTGDAFGNPNCIRISYAASTEQIKKAVERIRSAVEK